MKKSTVGVFAILGVGILLLVFVAFEWERVEDRTPPSAEARANPFLAFQRFLGEYGVEVDDRSRLGELPPTTGTVVWVHASRETPPEEVERLVGWVEQGGRLWILADPDWTPADVRAYQDDEVADPLLEELELGWRRSGRNTLSLEAELDGVEYVVDIGGDVATFVDAEWEVDTYGLVADVLHGNGSVVLCATSDWLTNDWIGEEDHAQLAWDLFRREGTPAGATFVRDREAFDFLAWISGPGFSLAVVLVLAIAFLIARRGMRLGPIQDELPSGRRDFAEHLQAAGTFLWKRGDRDGVVKRLRAAVAPGAPADADERREWIEREAERTGLSAERLREAWMGKKTPDAPRFVRIVRTLADQARAHPHVTSPKR